MKFTTRTLPPGDFSRRQSCLLMLALSVALCSLTGSPCVAADPARPDSSESVEVEFGLAKRTAWTSSNIRGFPDPPPPLKLVRGYPQINIPNLIALNSIPGSDYLLAVDHQAEWGGPSRVVQFKDQAAMAALSDVVADRLAPHGFRVAEFGYLRSVNTNKVIYFDSASMSQASLIVDALSDEDTEFALDDESKRKVPRQLAIYIANW